jgi:ABC-2 type transport system permease protein
MIRWHQARAVATFELLSTVKRPGYLIATFGMPLFLLLYGAIASIPGYLASTKKDEKTRLYAVVDETDVLRLEEAVELQAIELPAEAKAALESAGNDAVARALRRGSAVFTPYPFIDEARAALLDGTVRGVYHLPADYMSSGRVEIYRRDGGITAAEMATGQFRTLLRDRLLAGRVPPEIAARVESTIAERAQWIVADDGSLEPFSVAALVTRFAVPGVFAILLFVSLMMTSGYLLQGTATEKENKVVEVVLASADPDELLLGKLLGLGAAGMLQVLVWSSMVIAGSFVVAGVLALAGVPIPWLMIAVGLPFFIATYLFVGSLILASGSIGGNFKESQQWSMMWTLLMVVPFFFMALLIEEPNGGVAQTFTFIPFTSALTLLIRLTLEPEAVAWWQIGGAFVILVGAIWVAIRFGARLFRVGLLLTGSRPKLREILRQAKLASR